MVKKQKPEKIQAKGQRGNEEFLPGRHAELVSASITGGGKKILKQVQDDGK